MHTARREVPDPYRPRPGWCHLRDCGDQREAGIQPVLRQVHLRAHQTHRVWIRIPGSVRAGLPVPAHSRMLPRQGGVRGRARQRHPRQTGPGPAGPGGPRHHRTAGHDHPQHIAAGGAGSQMHIHHRDRRRRGQERFPCQLDSQDVQEQQQPRPLHARRPGRRPAPGLHRHGKHHRSPEG